MKAYGECARKSNGKWSRGRVGYEHARLLVEYSARNVAQGGAGAMVGGVAFLDGTIPAVGLPVGRAREAAADLCRAPRGDSGYSEDGLQRRVGALPI